MSNRRRLIFSLSLIFILIAIGVSSYFTIEAARKPGSYFTVTVNGERVGSYPLSVNAEYELNGGTNILVVEDGHVYMKSASCPDSLCVRQGKKSLSGQRIVCLPNKVMVEVFSDTDEIFEN